MAPLAGGVWFLKIDKGLENEADGVQLMKPMPTLDALLAKAKSKGIFGTKERSVIKQANADGIKAVVDQQLAVAKQVVAAGLVPIVEPEVDIHWRIVLSNHPPWRHWPEEFA